MTSFGNRFYVCDEATLVLSGQAFIFDHRPDHHFRSVLKHRNRQTSRDRVGARREGAGFKKETLGKKVLTEHARSES